MMYVEHNGGYITPCEVVKRIPGWGQVRLTAAGLSWCQWFRDDRILTEADVVEA
jgi:hypothetical protein